VIASKAIVGKTFVIGTLNLASQQDVEAARERSFTIARFCELAALVFLIAGPIVIWLVPREVALRIAAGCSCSCAIFAAMSVYQRIRRKRLESHLFKLGGAQGADAAVAIARAFVEQTFAGGAAISVGLPVLGTTVGAVAVSGGLIVGTSSIKPAPTNAGVAPIATFVVSGPTVQSSAPTVQSSAPSFAGSPPDAESAEADPALGAASAGVNPNRGRPAVVDAAKTTRPAVVDAAKAATADSKVAWCSNDGFVTPAECHTNRAECERYMLNDVVQPDSGGPCREVSLDEPIYCIVSNKVLDKSRMRCWLSRDRCTMEPTGPGECTRLKLSDWFVATVR
jgi:hypothetical protein